MYYFTRSPPEPSISYGMFSIAKTSRLKVRWKRKCSDVKERSLHRRNDNNKQQHAKKTDDGAEIDASLPKETGRICFCSVRICICHIK